MENNEFNKDSLKEDIKKKIKEKIKKELLEEISNELYNELKLEKEQLTGEITSSLDKKTLVKNSTLERTSIESIKTDEIITVSVKTILKVASHSLKYANKNIPRDQWVEVFGLLAGKLEDNNIKLCIEDAFPLGHGTAISWELKDPQSHEKAYRNIKKNNLFICGWYHSHPSYGLFMSQEDIHNHSIYQTLWERSVALVIDPYQIDGTSAGFDIFRANLKTKKWYRVPYLIEGALDVRMLPEILKFMEPIIEGRAAYLEYDEE